MQQIGIATGTTRSIMKFSTTPKTTSSKVSMPVDQVEQIRPHHNNAAPNGTFRLNPLDTYCCQFVEVVRTAFGPNLAPKAPEFFFLVYGGG